MKMNFFKLILLCSLGFSAVKAQNVSPPESIISYNEKIELLITKVKLAPTWDERVEAARQLNSFTVYAYNKQVSKKVIHEIIELLDFPDDATRFFVAMTLGNIGTQADEAVPKLKKLLPQVECVDGVANAASGITTALVKMRQQVPAPEHDCTPLAG